MIATKKFIKKEGKYWIEENLNYPEGEGNLFLSRELTYKERQTSLAAWKTLGGADKRGGKWIADITWIYDEETDSDALVVYEGESREEAIEALWNARFNAVSP